VDTDDRPDDTISPSNSDLPSWGREQPFMAPGPPQDPSPEYPVGSTVPLPGAHSPSEQTSNVTDRVSDNVTAWSGYDSEVVQTPSGAGQSDLSMGASPSLRWENVQQSQASVLSPSEAVQQPSFTAQKDRPKSTRWLVVVSIALVISMLGNVVLAVFVITGIRERQHIKADLGRTLARLEEATIQLEESRQEVDKLREENDVLFRGGAELFRRLDKARDLMKSIDSELESAYSNVYSALDHLSSAFDLYSRGYYLSAASEARAAGDALDRFNSNVRRYRQLRDEFRHLVDDLFA
jgi:hypothetical protein